MCQIEPQNITDAPRTKREVHGLYMNSHVDGFYMILARIIFWLFSSKAPHFVGTQSEKIARISDSEIAILYSGEQAMVGVTPVTRTLMVAVP
jgi:hypothetical protein